MAKELTQVQAAYARCKPARDHLARTARCMEVTEDPAGIVWERWILPNGVSVVLFATPSWWDVMRPVTYSGETAATLAALDEVAQAVRS